jgi:hypothetical protein
MEFSTFFAARLDLKDKWENVNKYLKGVFEELSVRCKNRIKVLNRKGFFSQSLISKMDIFKIAPVTIIEKSAHSGDFLKTSQ